MIKPPQLALLFLALMLGAAPLFAQTAPAEPAAPSSQAPTPAAQDTAAARQAPAPRDTPEKTTPPSNGKDSPFDYRASEEISEDVPVSFPVDI